MESQMAWIYSETDYSLGATGDRKFLGFLAESYTAWIYGKFLVFMMESRVPGDYDEIQIAFCVRRNNMFH